MAGFVVLLAAVAMSLGVCAWALYLLAQESKSAKGLLADALVHIASRDVNEATAAIQMRDRAKTDLDLMRHALKKQQVDQTPFTPEPDYITTADGRRLEEFNLDAL